MKHAAYLALALAVGSPVGADITVRFDEGAPKDRFSITNQGACPLGEVAVTLDLGASAAGLIFDVTSLGAGVSVFQPLEMVAGQEFLASVPEVKDGDSKITLPVIGLAPGASIAFTIDVDDTRGMTETMVSGAEISGAKAVVTGYATTAEATFGSNAIAEVAFASCSA